MSDPLLEINIHLTVEGDARAYAVERNAVIREVAPSVIHFDGPDAMIPHVTVLGAKIAPERLPEVIARVGDATREMVGFDGRVLAPYLETLFHRWVLCDLEDPAPAARIRETLLAAIADISFGTPAGGMYVPHLTVAAFERPREDLHPRIDGGSASVAWTCSGIAVSRSGPAGSCIETFASFPLASEVLKAKS